MRRGLQLRRASFYHGAKIRNSAVLPLAGNLLGSAFPKPCYGGLRRKKISTQPPPNPKNNVRCKVKGGLCSCQSDTTHPTAAVL